MKSVFFFTSVKIIFQKALSCFFEITVKIHRKIVFWKKIYIVSYKNIFVSEYKYFSSQRCLEKLEKEK